jgi:signal transduction histidine kinase
MKPRLARGLLVLGAFSLVGALSASVDYLASTSVSPPPAAHSPNPGFWLLFGKRFNYYLAWAAVTPGILWLARRVPFTRRRWWRPVSFHLLVAIAGSGPFFCLRLLIALVLGSPQPHWDQLAAMWARILTVEPLLVIPVYALLLGLSAALQSQRDYQAKQLRAIQLQQSLAAAQLDALRTTLQPHFLFNALGAIGALARSGETDAVVRVVEHLGRLLRLSMETGGREFVTVDEEMTLLDEYLSVERIRSRDRLQIFRRIDPRARKALVPNLILQPLVENALVHGLSRERASLLEIVASADDGELRLAVRDDGPGLPAGWTSASAAGRGLKNVADRLRALYPGHHQFSVRAGETGGVIAEVRVPLTEAGASADEE